jgi:hypothetical protein
MCLYKHNDRCTTSMTEYRLISVRSSGSIRIINSQTDGLVVTVHRIGHHGHRISTHYIPCVGLHESYGVYTQGEHERKLLQQFLSTARSINNAAMLRKVTSSLVTRVRICIQTEGGHFKHLALVLNGESVTVYLTTYLNKCTMLFFPF